VQTIIGETESGKDTGAPLLPSSGMTGIEPPARTGTDFRPTTASKA
jgi:hypothetical protein